MAEEKKQAAPESGELNQENQESTPEKKAVSEKKKPDGKKKKEGNFFTRSGAGIVKWFRELRSELKKVTWPTANQVVNNTWVVFVVMFVCAIVLWGFDFVAQNAVKTLITLVG